MNATTHESKTHRSDLVEAQSATHEFLTAALPDVQRVDVTKVAHVNIGDTAWEAEADVWQPNPTLKSLGIETGRPVLDQNHYQLRLDALFNVLEYELRESI
jgi:hypothetical protein